tara:strand:+ start:1006 stop:1848 length:843 start_codon:yes stop_codon:yes gene_type:complete
MKIYNAINKASELLKENGIISSKLDSEILISKVLGAERSNIILNISKELTEKEISIYNKLIQQRCKRKPIAYLTKKKEFWKYEFYVSKNVLIPRPDSELIVEKVLEFTKNKQSKNLLEIGVGSGCIILSILKEKNNFYGTGIDISKKSLQTCRINSDNLGVFNRLKLFKSDIDNFKYGKYDLIISNPPYIKKFDLKYLEKDVINYEPLSALNGGIDGLSEIRKVINNSTQLIKKKGILVLEIGFNQSEEVKKILYRKGFYINKVFKDLSKKNRCIVSTKI